MGACKGDYDCKNVILVFILCLDQKHFKTVYSSVNTIHWDNYVKEKLWKMFGYNYKFNCKYSVPPQNAIFCFIEIWVLLPVYDIVFDLFLSIMDYSCYIFMCFIILAIHSHRCSCLHFTHSVSIYWVSTCFRYYSTQRTYVFFCL